MATATTLTRQDNENGKTPVITLRAIKKAFGELEVLKGIDLDVFESENLVIMGKSGQGKSVTIKCIAGLLHPDSGDLQVLGEQITELEENDLRAIRKRMGFLFQSGALYDSMSVRENLEFPLKRILNVYNRGELADRVQEMLEAIGLPEVGTKMPSELSGGMKKRVGLARTMIIRPEIMLYDEPTTGLDAITSREISELILKMQAQHHVSSIIITHDVACASITANRVMILDEGQFIANGAFQELATCDDPFITSFLK